jgi:hypothetical protein
MLLGLVAVVLIVVGYLVLRRQAPAAPKTTTAPQQARAAEPTVTREPAENIVLPPIDESDPVVRELVGKLSSHPTVAAWLTTKGLIRNIAVVTVNIADGHTPSKQLQTIPPKGPFEASADTSGAVILPASYARYDTYADAVSGLDTRGTARLYATLKPRLQEAYRELGYPDGDFDEATKRAIVELLKTPVVQGPVALDRSSVSYTFADARLESLSAAQKQLLRMGPRNQKIIQDKLREIAPSLGIDPASLPQPVVIQASAPSR